MTKELMDPSLSIATNSCSVFIMNMELMNKKEMHYVFTKSTNISEQSYGKESTFEKGIQCTLICCI